MFQQPVANFVVSGAEDVTDFTGDSQVNILYLTFMMNEHDIVVKQKYVVNFYSELNKECHEVADEGRPPRLVKVITQLESITIVMLVREVDNSDEDKVKHGKEAKPYDCFADGSRYWNAHPVCKPQALYQQTEDNGA